MIHKWIYENRKTNAQTFSIKPNLILGMHSDLFTVHQNPNLCPQRLKRPTIVCLWRNFIRLVSLIAQVPKNCRNVRTTPNSSWPNFALAIPNIIRWCCVFIKWNPTKIVLCRHVTRLDSGSNQSRVFFMDWYSERSICRHIFYCISFCLFNLIDT